jgi:predicted TIM-barrel fold metal-dependent hydrolase
MHAGWPLGDAKIAVMFAHPQLHVDTGLIDCAYRRSDFHAYLKRLVDAGLGKRILSGSDQMVWPEAITAAIEGITSAPFLADEQKREILYNNAQRFLRLAPAPAPAPMRRAEPGRMQPAR